MSTAVKIDRWGRALRSAAPGVLTLVAVAIVWEIAGRTVLHALLPPPSAIAAELWQNWSVYPPNIAATLSEAARGWVIGNIAAIVLGCLFVTIPVVEVALLRVAIATYCLPIIAIGPILEIVFTGDQPKVVMAALSVFFTTLLGTMLGLRSADTTSLELIHAYGGSRWTALRKVALPFALPSIFVALQMAIPAALLGAIIGEYLGGDRGLGVAMVNAEQTFDLPRLWGFELVTAAVAIVGWGIGAWVCRLATPWATERRIDAGAFAPKDAAPRALVRDGLFLCVSIAIALGLWGSIIWALRLDDYFAKTPLDVWNYLATAAAAAANRAEIWSSLLVTVGDALIGYVGGTLIALLTAMTFVIARPVERALMPMVLTVRVIPLLSLTPLIVLLFGRGLLSVAVITGLITYFPTLLNLTTAMRSVPRDILDVMSALNASPLVTMVKVRLNYAVPALYASARIAAPGALIGAIVAEWLVTGEGLGSLMLSSAASSRYATLWASVTIVTLVSVLWYAAVGLVEGLVTASPFRRMTPTQRP
jgi:ABC-type nitrate/sulfonate/bicarbonate transport system permease component